MLLSLDDRLNEVLKPSKRSCWPVMSYSYTVDGLRFADEAPGAVARDGVADFPAGHNSDHARLVRRRKHVDDGQAAVVPAPVVVNTLKLAGTQQALAFRK